MTTKPIEEKILTLQRELRKLETKTLDGYVPTHLLAQKDNESFLSSIAHSPSTIEMNKMSNDWAEKRYNLLQKEYNKLQEKISDDFVSRNRVQLREEAKASGLTLRRFLEVKQI